MSARKDSIANIAMTELEDLAAERVFDGVSVTARCFAVHNGEHKWYEILIAGFEERATLDLHTEDDIERLRDRAMSVYASAARLRSGGSH